MKIKTGIHRRLYLKSSS